MAWRLVLARRHPASRSRRPPRPRGDAHRPRRARAPDDARDHARDAHHRRDRGDRGRGAAADRAGGAFLRRHAGHRGRGSPAGRLRHLVYIDAVLPEPGESWSSTHTSATREARLAAAEASPDFSFPPPDAAIFGLAGEQYDWVARRQTPHPGHTYQSPLDFDARRVASVPRTFIDCTEPALATIDVSRRRVADPNFWAGAWRAGGGARVVTMKIGHDAMVIDPAGLSRILLDCC